MARATEPLDADVERHPGAQDDRDLLRFITCGSVDDGKSTLIGRLLHDAHALYDDQLAALAADSIKFGTQGGDLDFALLMDGLSAEREQGITIDVAYRYFATDKRHFIVADTPGHEQYTRNMVTGASTASVALLLVDARKGVQVQTRRHIYLATLLGLRNIVLAVNKLDLVAYDQAAFDRISRELLAYAAQIGAAGVTCIPVSALRGDNVTKASPNMRWFSGPTLMQYLESVSADDDAERCPFRMPVQWVNRPSPEFRGYSGRIVGGTVRPGQAVKLLPSGSVATVARIVTQDGDLDLARSGQSVTLTLHEEIDVSRGDMLAAADAPAGIADQFEATVIWMGDDPLLPGRSYLLQIGARTVGATVAPPKYKINVNTLEHVAARNLQLNEIGVCTVVLDQTIAFDAYSENRDTGGFILIDRLTHATAGAGLLHFALRRSQNIRWQEIDVDKEAHAALKRQRPCIVWFTGISGAGKSTIANLVEKQLHASGHHTYLLDGDNVRHGLNRDLGFTEADRVENIRRVAEVARLMVDAGLIVLVSFISPFAAERKMARALVAQGEFLEVFVDAPVEVAEQRDPKGLYAKARRGELKNFTGIDSPYERPDNPDLHIDAATMPAGLAAQEIVARLRLLGVLDDGKDGIR